MSKTKPKLLFSDQLKLAIDNCGMSRYELCKQSGTDNATLSRFMSGRHMLSMATVDSLVACLDVELRPIKPQREGR